MTAVEGARTPSRLSSARDDWRTPDWILNAVRQIGPIGLDPATSPDNPTGARSFFTPAEDGLCQRWKPEPGTLVFLNPPFSRSPGDGPRLPYLEGRESSQVHAWLRKAHVEADRGAPVFVLLSFCARVEMPAFQGALSTSRSFSGLWLPRGRVGYVDPTTGHEKPGPNFPSCALLFGIHFAAAVAALGLFGALLRPERRWQSHRSFSPLDVEPGWP